MRLFDRSKLYRGRSIVVWLMLAMVVLCWWQILHKQHHNTGLAFTIASQHTDTQPMLKVVDHTFVAKKDDIFLGKDISLQGVVMRADHPALALLRFGSGQAQWYQEGQHIVAGLLLQKVLPQAVSVSKNGQWATVRLAHRGEQ